MSNKAVSSFNVPALSATSSSTSVARKQPPYHLEAIQTLKAQASVTFRPVSFTGMDSLDIVDGVYGGLSPQSPCPSHPSAQHQQSEHPSQDQQQEYHRRSGPGVEVVAEARVEGEDVKWTSMEPTMTTATTADDSFPFTPSTLVEGIPSPVVNLHGSGNGNSSQCYPLFTSAGRDVSQLQPYPSRQQQQSHSGGGPETQRSLQQHHATFSKMDSPNCIGPRNTSANTTMPPTGVGFGSGSGSGKSQGSQGMDLTYSNSSDDSRFQHLPTLWQVLHRKTLPPVCLFNFYLYMRDHERSSEEVDFWLDVTAHELLWRLYVRATKRRLAQERIGRGERNAEEAEERERVRDAAAALALAEAEMFESEQWKLQQVQEQEQDLSENGHQKKSSVSLDMYEPHWSAVNRYLEISESGLDSYYNAASTAELKSGLDEIQHQQHQSDQVTEGSHITRFKGSSEPMVLQYTVPTSPLSPTPTMQRDVPDLPGVVQDNWGHDTVAGSSGVGGFSAGGSVTKNGGANSVGVNVGMANTRRSINIKQTVASGTSGVTKEDLQESAERIYYKYLIPQAETPVRIPGSVRRRIAQLMDSKIIVNPTAVVAGVAMSKHKNTVDTANLANAPFPPPMTSPTSPIPNSNDRLKISPRSDPHHPHRSSNNTSNNANSLQQPDQDLGLVFAEAREIVFEGMESYYFPRFIQARAYGNMVHSHRVARAVLGLFILFVGFAVMLCLIFLNRPGSLRRWALITIFVGILICTTFQFDICPLMAAFGVSEAKWMQFGKIREPHIMMLHRKRAVKVVVVAVLYTFCVGTIFEMVPGHRL